VRPITWTIKARADLAKLDDKTRTRVDLAVHRFADEHIGDIKKLHGRSNAWRLRVGDYRVIFSDDPEGITVSRVLSRQSAHRE
jgi:mRNA interferase RelE/StbE